MDASHDSASDDRISDDRISDDRISPQVTVVIPVFNGTNYLAEAIESVLAQTYTDFEILVVDDGSTDDTWALVQQYVAAYPSMVRGLRKPNGGAASALNAGIRTARGKYFAWLSHDDRWVPHKLARQFEALADDPGAMGVYSDYDFIDGEGETIGSFLVDWFPREERLRYLIQMMYINGSTLLVERHCLTELGYFNESVRYAQDALMWVHLVMRFPLTHVPERLTQYRIHPAQTTLATRRQALRADNKIWLTAAITSYRIEEIFPELTHPGATRENVAAAHLYLAEVLISCHLQLGLGLRQFWRAWLARPVPWSPVFRRFFQALHTARLTYLEMRKQKKADGVSFNPPLPPYYAVHTSGVLLGIKVTGVEPE